MKGFGDGAESFLELLLPAVLKRELKCNSFGLKRVIVAWEGPLRQTRTWMGRRFGALRRQMGVEGK